MRATLAQYTKEVEDVIAHSQEYPFRLDASHLINDWYKAKLPYIKLFGDSTTQLIQENISLELTEEQKRRKFNSFLYRLEETYDSIDVIPPNGLLSLRNFLIENRAGFFENTVIIPHEQMKIVKGMKILRCFKYFDLGFNTCRAIQDLASRFIQGGKLQGNLYLSVDPLDYLSISENNSNWRSCHALDGEFRAGNVNYMADETTLVAYLAPSKPVQLKNFPQGLLWNDKKWRMLIHTNFFKSVCWYNRQYPFSEDQLLKIVGRHVAELSEDRLWSAPRTDFGFKTIQWPDGEREDLEHNYVRGLRGRLYDMREIIDCSGNLGYSDLCYSPYFAPPVSPLINSHYEDVCCEVEDMKEWDKAFHDEYDIAIGKPCKCLRCGRDYIQREDSFLCDECIAVEDYDEDAFLHCERCGRRLFDPGEEYWLGNSILCKECYDILSNEELYPVGIRRQQQLNL